MKARKYFFNSGLVSILFVLSAQAYAADVSKAVVPQGMLASGMDACREDIAKWCKDVTPGAGRLGRCLNANLKNLSKPCRRFARHGGKGQELESLVDIDRNYLPSVPGDLPQEKK